MSNARPREAGVAALAAALLALAIAVTRLLEPRALAEAAAVDAQVDAGRDPGGS